MADDKISTYWLGAPPAPSTSLPPVPAYYGGPPPLEHTGTLPEYDGTSKILGVAPTGAMPPPPAPTQPGVEALPPELRGTVTGALGALPTAKPAPQAAATIGPTAADNAAFERFKAEKSAEKAVPGAVRTALGGGGGGVDRVGAAQKDLLKSYDAKKDAVRAQSVAEQDRAVVTSGMRADLAREQQEDAGIARLEQEEFQRDYDGKLAEIERQADEVRSRKVDPSRMFRGDGMATMAIVGGVLGGLYQGLNKLGSNPFMDDLNRQIDRDIRAQEKDLDTAQQGITNKRGILNDQRATFKDNQLAKMQARNLYYEATKGAIEAEAAKFDSPIAKAHADQAIAAIDTEQQQLKVHMAERAQAASAAHAAQRAALAKEQRGAWANAYEKLLQSGMPPERAEGEATRAVQIQFGGTAPPRDPNAAGASRPDLLANVPKSQQAKAAEELEARAQKDAAAESFTKIAADATEKLGSAAWRAESAIPGTTAHKERFEMNAVIHQRMTGKGLASENDADKAITPFFISPTDSPQDAQRKMRNATTAFDARNPTPIVDYYSPTRKAPMPTRYDVNTGKPKS